MFRYKIIISILIIISSICNLSAQENWSVELPRIGTFSSPRATDLNGDGIKDIILGAGKKEFEKSDSAIIALDGKNGKLLWNAFGNDQMFGTPAFYDITKDGIDDIFITGRSSEFKAINGKSGKVIWAFDTTYYSLNKTKRWFNFYNPQLIPDMDSDGFKDFLVANGGDIWIAPHDPNRAAGRIVIISSKTGRLLHEAIMPDEKEIYMSVVIREDKTDLKKSKFIFGTGGETVGGNLFVGDFEMVIKGDLSKSIKLDECQNKGFIAPPAWVDITGDEVLDVVVNSVDGRILSYDGITFKKIWEVILDGTEAYSSMAIGKFNQDTTPDFFVSFAQGVWPKLSWTKQAMIDGKYGKIQFLDSLGYYQTSSPIVADLNEDGFDEVILNVDYQILDSLNRKTFYNTLYAIEFRNKETLQLVDGLPGHNVSSTPLACDLEDDGFLDLIYIQGTNQFQTYTFDGLRVNCLKTKIPIKNTLKWGAYMGSNMDGVYR